MKDRVFMLTAEITAYLNDYANLRGSPYLATFSSKVKASLRILASYKYSCFPQPGWPTNSKCYYSLNKILLILKISFNPFGASKNDSKKWLFETALILFLI